MLEIKDILNTIICADSLEIMRQLPDKSIDLIVCDPPYGLNSKMKGGTWGGNAMYSKMTGEDSWDKLLGQEYFDEMYRVSKNQIIWGGNYYTMPPSRCWLAWIKKERMDTLADFELAWTSFGKLAKSYDERRNPDGKRQHPTQKPLSLMQWCIKNYSQEGQLILDPFAGGGGSTLKACKLLKRDFIGIEISEDYVKIAQSRLDNMNTMLF